MKHPYGMIVYLCTGFEFCSSSLRGEKNVSIECVWYCVVLKYGNPKGVVKHD